MSSFLLTKLKLILDVVPSPLHLPIFISLSLVFLSWLYIRLARGKYDMKTLQKIPAYSKALPLLGNALDVNVPPEQVLGKFKEMVDKVRIN